MFWSRAANIRSLGWVPADISVSVIDLPVYFACVLVCLSAPSMRIASRPYLGSPALLCFHHFSVFHFPTLISSLVMFRVSLLFLPSSAFIPSLPFSFFPPFALLPLCVFLSLPPLPFPQLHPHCAEAAVLSPVVIYPSVPQLKWRQRGHCTALTCWMSGVRR